MLHLGDEDLVAAGERPSHRLGHQVEAFGGPAGEDDLLARARAHEGADRVAGRLVQLRGLLAQGVDGAVHVGVAPLVVALDRLDHRRRLLAGRRRVQIVQRMAIDDPAEDGEIGPGDLAERHRPTSLPSSAPWSTDRGSVTHFILDGRISASRRSSSWPAPSEWTRSAGWPSISSISTSAAAAAMAQLSPVKRASATRPPVRRHSMRIRSPQSGFTSSKDASGSGTVPRKRGCRNRSRITLLYIILPAHRGP